MELRGRILTTEGWLEGGLVFSEHIERLVQGTAESRIILPGFIDPHVHGGGGADVMEGEEATRRMARFHARHGTTTLLATTVTARPTAIEAALLGVSAVVREPNSGEARVLGAHLEGPLISAEKLGAQPPYPLVPDLGLMKRWLGLAPVRVVTLAPEIPGAPSMVRFLHERGVRVQLGHSAGDYSSGLVCLQAGAEGFTHLFNAMTGLHHRVPGLVGLALEQADWAELITDGLHVDPAVVRVALKAIPGLYVITDAVAAAGMPDGLYPLGSSMVNKRGEGVYTDAGSLAGSTLTMDQALRNLVGWGLPLNEAAARVSSFAADYLGLADWGRIQIGAPADLVVLSNDLQIEEVYVGGRIVFPDGA